jgi:hypothetical protein
MQRRITLINALDHAREWRLDDDAPSRLVFGSFFKVIRSTKEERGDDIERVILDRTADDAELLQMLAHLSESFAGDVLFIRERKTSYLSAVGRNAGRTLYALCPDDVRFYLETHGLVAPASVAAA